ncbi:MAG: hypothetical protein KIG70_10065, partial [Treponema sp.]|uniref:hypothetical protein n=1 Tax=Treponema sp. TaxID=166 RepID=UPI001D653EA4
MTGNKIEELLVELLQKVSSIDALLSNSQSILRDHEHRIDVLERHPSNQKGFQGVMLNTKDSDIKSNLLLLLAKSLLIALVSIGTLAGAGTILSNIFNINQPTQTQTCSRS